MGCLLLLMVVVGLPMAEISVIRKVAAQIGGWDTFFLLIFSAVMGTYLAKHQGAMVLRRVQQCLAEGRVPTIEMVDGLLVFFGGVLFISPGFITDGLGLLLIFPLTRWLICWIILAKFQVSRQRHSEPRQQPSASRVDAHSKKDRSGVVDAEVVE